MTIKHINFSDSPVMRGLERNAIKNKTFQPKAEEIVKQASLNKYASTNNLYNDMFILASGLRQSGFLKEAEILENKIIICKQADTHLYRAIDEDGEDLIDFAHPDGSVHISDAKDDNGNIENPLSKHKKIVDIVNKQPTGKMASILINAAETLNIKTSQFDINNYIKPKSEVTPTDVATTNSVSGAIDAENTAKFHNLLDNLKTNLRILGAILVSGFPEYKNLMSYLNSPPSLGITNEMKRVTLNDFKNKFSVLNKLTEGSADRELLKFLPSFGVSNSEKDWQGNVDLSKGKLDTSKEKLNVTINNIFVAYNTTLSFLSSLIGDSIENKLQHKSSSDVVSIDQIKSVINIFARSVRFLENWRKIA